MPDQHPPSPGPEVVLHAERLDVDVERVRSRAVVRRRVVTERRTLDVTVRREVLEVEHEALPDDAPDQPSAGSAGPHVIVLSEEVPVVELRLRPYERVTLDVQTVTEQHEVAETLGEERVEVTTDRIA